MVLGLLLIPKEEILSVHPVCKNEFLHQPIMFLAFRFRLVRDAFLCHGAEPGEYEGEDGSREEDRLLARPYLGRLEGQ
jgi:hypothetical protein